MNRYSIKSHAYALDNAGANVGALKQLVKAFAHSVLFGIDVTVDSKPVIDGNQDPLTAPMGSTIEFTLPYSLSSVISKAELDDASLLKRLPRTPNTVTYGDLPFTQPAYSSNSQETREYIDKPYPRKGYLCVFLADVGDTDFRKDLDDYISIPFAVYQSNNDATVLNVKGYNIIFGYVNSSKTDFYSPLDKYVQSGLIEIIDPIQSGLQSSGLSSLATRSTTALLSAGTPAISRNVVVDSGNYVTDFRRR